MRLNKLTNLVIFTLVAAAVFQTGELWLGNTESHNFFYSLVTHYSDDLGVTDKVYDIIEPEKTVVGYGNKKFNMLYSDKDGLSIVSLTENVIRDVFENGTYQSVSEIKWDEYIDGKAVIMKFPFYVSTAEYIKGYALSNSDFLNNVKSINYIVVVPSGGTSETSSCYFIDSSSSEAYRFDVGGTNSSAALYNAIQTMQYSSGSPIEYISTVQSGMNIFDSIYVPQWPEGVYSYDPVRRSNPFEKNGETDPSVIEKYANYFFDNYVTGSDISNVNGIYTLSNDDIVVKYYETGIFEYYNYDVGISQTEQTLVEAYTISRNFIGKDQGIMNDIYLSGAETRSDGLVFYYDYTLNNIPIKISDDLAEQTGMAHAIEIVVNNGNVKRYKRYAVDFSADTQSEAKINVDMITAWDDAIINYTGNDVVTSVSDMYIGYLADVEEELYIRWFTNVNGSTIIGETYK